MAVERYHHFDGQLLTVMMIFHEAGDVVDTHAHNAEHTLIVACGHLEVTEGDLTYDLKAPALATIPRGVPHGLRAPVAGTVATCALIPRDENNLPLTREVMDGMSPYELWQAQGRV